MKFCVKTPILGFEQVKNVELKKIDDFFHELKSLDGKTSFILINPFLLRSYNFTIPKYFKDILAIQDDTELLVYNTVLITDPVIDSTINFLAPILFNKTDKCMGQIVLDNTLYKKYKLIDKISNYIN